MHIHTYMHACIHRRTWAHFGLSKLLHSQIYHAGMSVCLFVCMYVCMYVVRLVEVATLTDISCRYVCVFGYVWVYVCLPVCLYVYMYVCSMYLCGDHTDRPHEHIYIYIHICVRIYIYIYVCMYICI